MDAARAVVVATAMVLGGCSSGREDDREAPICEGLPVSDGTAIVSETTFVVVNLTEAPVGIGQTGCGQFALGVYGLVLLHELPAGVFPCESVAEEPSNACFEERLSECSAEVSGIMRLDPDEELRVKWAASDFLFHDVSEVACVAAACATPGDCRTFRGTPPGPYTASIEVYDEAPCEPPDNGAKCTAPLPPGATMRLATATFELGTDNEVRIEIR